MILLLVVTLSLFLIGFLFGWLLISGHYEKRLKQNAFFTPQDQQELTNFILEARKKKKPSRIGEAEGDLWMNDEHWEWKPKRKLYDLVYPEKDNFNRFMDKLIKRWKSVK
jgi:hypothetical protein